MEESLCQKLESIDDCRRNLLDSYERARTNRGGFLERFGETYSRQLPEIYLPSEVDVVAEKRKVIKSYMHNPVLRDAVEGKQSIEETTQELIVRGIRRFLPIRKNESHNRKAEHLGELISHHYAHYMKTRGILAPDNVFNLWAYYSLGIWGFIETCAYLDITPLNSRTIGNVIIAAIFSGFMVCTLGNLPQVTSRGTIRVLKEIPIKSAKYLDSTIKEVFNQQF